MIDLILTPKIALWDQKRLKKTPKFAELNRKRYQWKLVYLYKYTSKMISDLLSMTKVAHLGPKNGQKGLK